MKNQPHVKYLKRNEYLFFMEKQWTDIWKQLQV